MFPRRRSTRAVRLPTTKSPPAPSGFGMNEAAHPARMTRSGSKPKACCKPRPNRSRSPAHPPVRMSTSRLSRCDRKPRAATPPMPPPRPGRRQTGKQNSPPASHGISSDARRWSVAERLPVPSGLSSPSRSPRFHSVSSAQCTAGGAFASSSMGVTGSMNSQKNAPRK